MNAFMLPVKSLLKNYFETVIIGFGKADVFKYIVGILVTLLYS